VYAGKQNGELLTTVEVKSVHRNQRRINITVRCPTVQVEEIGGSIGPGVFDSENWHESFACGLGQRSVFYSRYKSLRIPGGVLNSVSMQRTPVRVRITERW
jgi:hypothetical protein